VDAALRTVSLVIVENWRGSYETLVTVPSGSHFSNNCVLTEFRAR